MTANPTRRNILTRSPDCPAPVIPAKAGTQRWVPAFAGMTGLLRCQLDESELPAPRLTRIARSVMSLLRDFVSLWCILYRQPPRIECFAHRLADEDQQRQHAAQHEESGEPEP